MWVKKGWQETLGVSPDGVDWQGNPVQCTQMKAKSRLKYTGNVAARLRPLTRMLIPRQRELVAFQNVRSCRKFAEA
eukprot:2103870-Rhodomonas_salina.1